MFQPSILALVYRTTVQSYVSHGTISVTQTLRLRRQLRSKSHRNSPVLHSSQPCDGRRQTCRPPDWGLCADNPLGAAENAKRVRAV